MSSDPPPTLDLHQEVPLAALKLPKEGPEEPPGVGLLLTDYQIRKIAALNVVEGVAVKLPEPEEPGLVTYEEFCKVDLRMGEVLEAERVPKSDKLLKLQVDFGPLGKRQILAGVGKSYEPHTLVGLRLLFVVNLPPRKMMGLESHGMLLAAGEPPTVISPSHSIAVGSRVG